MSLKKTLKEHIDHYVDGSKELAFSGFRTGLIGLNFAISKTGIIPGGSLIQLVGEPGTGKSTLALDIIRRAQQESNLRSVEIPFEKTVRHINCVYLDFERSYTPDYARSVGVNTDQVMVVRTPIAEHSFNIMEALMLEGVQLFIIDSVGMMVTKDEEERAFDETDRMGTEAKLLKQVVKKFLIRAFDTDSLVVVINHFRANISTMSRTDKKPFGARILHYGMRATIELIKIKNIDGGIGAGVKAHIAKSRLGPTGKVTEFDLIYGKGYDYAGHTLTLAENHGIINKNGSWYEYGDLKAQGLDKAAEKFPIAEIEHKVQQVLEGANNNGNETNTRNE